MSDGARPFTRLNVGLRELAAVLIGVALGLLVEAVLLGGVTVTQSNPHQAQASTIRPHPRWHVRRRRNRIVITFRAATTARTYTKTIPAVIPPVWGAPGAVGSGPPPIALIDPTGRYTVGGTCGQSSGLGNPPNVCEAGRVVGVYVDDTTPAENAVIAAALSSYDLVIVGVAAGTSTCPSADPHVLCAQEFYPYDCRYPPGQWGAEPAAQAYIIQWYYAWPGCGPPTPAERSALLAATQALHPRLILLY